MNRESRCLIQRPPGWRSISQAVNKGQFCPSILVADVVILAEVGMITREWELDLLELDGGDFLV
jgi:hypothetical protein